MKTETKGRLLVGTASLLLVGALGYAWATYRSYSDPLNDGLSIQRQMGRGPFGFGPPTPQQREEMQERMRKELGLSAEQESKLREIAPDGRTGPPSPEDFAKLRAILTPEQQQRMEQVMRTRMKERISMLPEEEQQKFMQKLDAARAEGRLPMFGPPAGRPTP
jgi:Spy/CpxP family protein refolding chaperone